MQLLTITSTTMMDCGSVQIVGKFGINGHQYSMHVDKNVYEDGSWNIDVCLFPEGENHWFKAENVKNKMNWGKYGILNFDMDQTLALAGLAFADRKIEREIAQVA